MRSGDRPGLQNRRAAGNPAAGGFDPHSLPPFSMTCAGWNHFGIRQGHRNHLPVCCEELIRDDGPVHIAVSHHFPLHTDCCTGRIEP